MSHNTFDDFKIGDTLSVAGTALLDAGTWTATAWLCNAKNEKVGDFVVTLEPLETPTDTATHAISLEFSATTCATLAPGLYTTDIRLADGAGNVAHSPQFSFDLPKPKTGVPTP